MAHTKLMPCQYQYFQFRINSGRGGGGALQLFIAPSQSNCHEHEPMPTMEYEKDHACAKSLAHSSLSNINLVFQENQFLTQDNAR
jgi:hypothetical protein